MRRGGVVVNALSVRLKDSRPGSATVSYQVAVVQGGIAFSKGCITIHIISFIWWIVGMDRNLKDLGLFIQCLQPRELKPSTCFSDSTRTALHLEKTRFKLSQFPRTSRKYAAAFSISVLWSSLHGYLAKKWFTNKQMDCCTNLAKNLYTSVTLPVKATTAKTEMRTDENNNFARREVRYTIW